MNKYIVKNCPAFVLMQNAKQTHFNVCGNAKIGTQCKDRTDCIIKQIYDYTDDIRENYNKHSMGALDVACNINDKFEIEEVKDNAG